MSKVLLHIGPHKTGTTYIQQQFLAHQAALAEQGWLYPELGRPANQAGHHDLAHASHKYLWDAEGALAEKIHELSAANQNLVLSAEGFCMWGQDRFERLRVLLGASTVDLVYYIRDPYDVFYSYWKEEVKQGVVASLPEKFMAHFANPFRSRLLNPMVDLNRYRRFGPNFSIKLMPYDYLMRRKIDIFQTLVGSAMGIDTKFEDHSGTPNSSLSIEMTEFLRLMIEEFRVTYGVKGKAVRFALYDMGVKNISTMVAAAFQHDLVKKKKHIELDRTARTFQAIERQVLSAYKNEFLVYPDNDKLFSTDPVSFTYYDKWDVLSDPHVKALYEELKAAVSRKFEEDGRFVREAELL